MEERCSTYARTIWRLAVFLIVVPYFVEVVFIELPDKAGKVAVLEMLGENVFCEFFVLRAGQCVELGVAQRRTSSTTKLSPSFPQRTTFSSVGFSNILPRALVAVRCMAWLGTFSLLVQLANEVAGVVGTRPPALPGLHRGRECAGGDRSMGQGQVHCTCGLGGQCLPAVFEEWARQGSQRCRHRCRGAARIRGAVGGRERRTRTVGRHAQGVATSAQRTTEDAAQRWQEVGWVTAGSTWAGGRAAAWAGGGRRRSCVLG